MNELEMLTQFNNDVKWLHNNFEKIQEKYPKKYVAILHKDDGIEVESDKDLENLIRNLKKKNVNPALTLIRFIYEKGARVVLY